MTLSRRSFVLWVTSHSYPDTHPRTLNNRPDDFTFELPPGWHLPGTWAVSVVGAMTSEVDDSQTLGDLMVCTDLIDHALVGHGYFPLIDRIAYTQNPSLRYQESLHPFRRRVNGNRFEQIGFKITDANGKTPVWKTPFYETVLALLFEPKDSNYGQSAMDQTFVSNQSLPYFSNNNASCFTAKLPSLQRLTDPRWKVGCTKITLPPAATTMNVSEWKVSLIPSFPISDTAQTTVTLGPIRKNDPSSVGSIFPELEQEFNSKMKNMIASWFPLDPHAVGVGGATKEDRQITIGTTTLTFNEGSTFKDIYETMSGNWYYIGTQASDSSKLTLYVPHDEIPQFTGLLARLGFTAVLPVTPTDFVTIQNIPLLRYEATKKPFEGETQQAYMIECRMHGKWFGRYMNPAVTTRFYSPGDQHELRLIMPEGMYDMLGLNKQGLEIKMRGKDGVNYIETVVKFGNPHPHNVETEVGYDHHTTFNYPYLKDLKHYYFVGQEGDYQSLSNHINPTTQRLEITLHSTIIPQAKIAYIRCSLLNLQQVGNRRIPLLDIVPLSAASHGDTSQPKQYVFEPKHVKYYPLLTNTFQNITFEVEDEHGAAIPFVSHGVTTITLRFQK